MLDDDAYLRWLEKSGFSDPARTLLTDIRRSPPAPTSAGEAKPVRTRRTNTRPGTRKPKRDAVSDSAGASTQQT